MCEFLAERLNIQALSFSTNLETLFYNWKICKLDGAQISERHPMELGHRSIILQEHWHWNLFI